MRFEYRPRSPFLLLQRLAKIELQDVDRLVVWSEQQRIKRQKLVEGLARRGGDDDRFVDDFSEVDAFAELFAECAIVALWRCIELFRKCAIAQVLDPGAATAAYEHRAFSEMLVRVHITESQLSCADAVNELRCINNAVKHAARVDGELAKLPRWKHRRGESLGDLRSEYARLRPLAESYIEDLANKASAWWAHERA